MTGREFQFYHSDNEACDFTGTLEITNVCIFSNCVLVIICRCPKCGKDDFRFPHELKDLYKFALKIRQEDKNRPLKPPLALPKPEPAKFTDQDDVEAHGLGIIIPPDEATQ